MLPPELKKKMVAAELKGRLANGRRDMVETCLKLYRHNRVILAKGLGATGNEFLLSVSTQYISGKTLSEKQIMAAGRILAGLAPAFTALLNGEIASEPVSTESRFEIVPPGQVDLAESCTCESYDGEALCPCCRKQPALVAAFEQRRRELVARAGERCSFYGSW